MGTQATNEGMCREPGGRVKTFYVTTSSSMPGGSGYWEIRAADADEARALAHKKIPEGRWAFLYDDLESVHPLDRKRHGVIS